MDVVQSETVSRDLMRASGKKPNNIHTSKRLHPTPVNPVFIIATYGFLAAGM
jgi:hypothetical protein